MKIKAREGELIETTNNIIFDIKGVVHPPERVIAFIRYVPDLKGDRERDGRRYSKFYSLSKRFDLLKSSYPQYLINDPIFNTLLCEVPVKDIKNHYQPIHGLQNLRKRKNLDTTETAALQFMKHLKKEEHIPWNRLGVSGSILVKLHNPSSDIDLIVYGSKTGHMVAKTMKRLLENKDSPFKKYDLKGLKELFDFQLKE